MNKSIIWFGPKMMGLGLFFCVIVPVFNHIFAKIIDKEEFFTCLIYGSMVTGILLIIFFALVLLINYNRVQYLRRFFMRRRRYKIETTDGYCECLYCGNKKVKKDDSSCFVCGVRFL